jgi:hypothetical protein
MITQKLRLSLFALLLTSTASWAASSAEEAAKMQASFQTYLGNEAGIVTVAPAGDGYDITIDPMVYFNKVKEPGFTASFKPLVYHAESSGDGLWKVDAQQAIDVSFGNPASLTVDMKLADYKLSGTFSEELVGFLDVTSSSGPITLAENIVDPRAGVSTNVTAAIQSMLSVFKAVPTGGGSADTSMDITYDNMTMNTTSVSSGGSGQPISLAYNMPKMAYTSKANGMNNRKLLDLLAWFVARPTKEQIVRDQAELKTKLKAVLPVAKNITGSASMDTLKVTSPIGVVSFDSFGFGANINGIVKDGHFGESINFTGLQIPEGIAPPWSAGLIPTTLKFGFDVSGFDAEAPATMFIDQMDISKDDPIPPGSEQLYMGAFAPKNIIQLTIPAGEISSGTYSLTYEGTSTISFTGLPQVNAKFRMTGMDKVIAQLQQAATDPTAQQGMAMLFAAKGIGKADGDAITWDVTMSPEGKLLVNGTDLSSMMGAIAPPPQQ